MAILLTPTHPHTMPSLPPQVYLKHIPFTHIPSLIATPHHSDMISMGALAARVNGLESEVILLQEKNKELHQLMEDRSDFMNMQLLFLGSFVEHAMELNAEKEQKKSQNPFRVQAGRAFVLSNDEMIDLVARGEVTRLAKEDSHMAQKATKAVKSANKTKLDAWKAAKDQAWAVAKLDNEAALA